jgi:hypothetical protein
MKNLENQQVCVFVNEHHKFVHIGVYNMYDKDGRPNYGATLQSSYNDAVRAARNANKMNAKGSDNAFGNSFLVRLMNTSVDQWKTATNVRDLLLSEAQDKAKELSDFYESNSYKVTGSLGAKAVRHLGSNKYATSATIKNATMQRLYQIVEKLTEGHHEVLNMSRVKSDIYRRYNDVGNFDTRRKFWNFINENFDQYMTRSS